MCDGDDHSAMARSLRRIAVASCQLLDERYGCSRCGNENGGCMRLILFAIMAGLSGCASILDGTSQQVSINTNPSGADCALYRQSERIATIQNTPGSALIQKSKYNIWIACTKPGYLPASYLNHSGLTGASFGNVLAGGLIGVAVDSATGADNKYEGVVNVSMVPKPVGAPDVSALPQTFDGVFPQIVVAPAPAALTTVIGRPSA